MSKAQPGYEAASQPVACPVCGWDCDPTCGLHPMGCRFTAQSAVDEGGWMVAPSCDRRHPVFVPLGLECFVCGANEGDLHDLADEKHLDPKWSHIGRPAPFVPGSDRLQ